jgi:hypothetical protein
MGHMYKSENPSSGEGLAGAASATIGGSLALLATSLLADPALLTEDAATLTGDTRRLISLVGGVRSDMNSSNNEQ